jgi:hypothetical protein
VLAAPLLALAGIVAGPPPLLPGTFAAVAFSAALAVIWGGV